MVTRLLWLGIVVLAGTAPAARAAASEPVEGDDPSGRRGDRRQRHHVGVAGEDAAGLHVHPASLAGERRNPECREADESGGDVARDEDVEQQVDDGHDGALSHSSSFDHRRRPATFRTAMATAFFCPTSTTSRLPRVTPV